MNWISTNEELPPIGEKVFTYDTFYNHLGTDCIVEIDKFQNPIWGTYLDDENVKITFWMPFPEKPGKHELD